MKMKKYRLIITLIVLLGICNICITAEISSKNEEFLTDNFQIKVSEK